MDLFLNNDKIILNYFENYLIFDHIEIINRSNLVQGHIKFEHKIIKLFSLLENVTTDT